MADKPTGGTVELADGAYVKACEVKFINVKDEGGGESVVSVLYGSSGWQSRKMSPEAAKELACEINQRVNESLGTTACVVTKDAKKGK